MATEEDRIDTGVLLTIGTVLTIGVVGVALALTALVRDEAESLEAEKGVTANLRPIQELNKEQRQLLEGTPTWVDKAANQVTLPLARAQSLVLDEIKKDPNKATALAPPPDAGTKAEAPDAGALAPEGGAEGEGADGGATPAPEQPGDNPPTEEGEAPKAPKPKPPAPPTAPEAPEPEPEPEAP